MNRDARRTAGALATRRPEGDGDEGERVHLVVPPSSRFLRTARLVAADAAERAGCDVEEIEDFRIAVDELCHLLMAATDHFVHVTVTTFDAHVVARGSTHARAGAAHELDEVSSMIVAGTADELEIVASPGELAFEVVKHARRAFDAGPDPEARPR
ncbi:MAG: hypothetical protein ACHQIG_03485 [Acidimicrobiia bacterium]